MSNRASEKIAQLADNVYMGRSGDAADCQAVSDYGAPRVEPLAAAAAARPGARAGRCGEARHGRALRFRVGVLHAPRHGRASLAWRVVAVSHFVEQHSLELDRDVEVKTVANLCSEITYNNKGAKGGMGLSAALVIGGWDKYEGAQVFALTIGGTLVRVPWAIDGSGSTILWSFFDDQYKDGMTREEAEAFVLKAISLVIARDASCGGNCRMVVITDKGAERKYFPHDKLPVWLDEMAPPGVQPITFTPAGGMVF